MSPGKWLWVRHFEFLKPTKIPLTSLLNLTGYHKYLKAVHILYSVDLWNYTRNLGTIYWSMGETIPNPIPNFKYFSTEVSRTILGSWDIALMRKQDGQMDNQET